MTTPAGPAQKDYRATLFSLGGEDDVIRQLLIDDPGADQPRTSRPRFLYRGQKSRHERSYPPEPRAGHAPDSMLFDSLIPSDYRDLETVIRARRAGHVSAPNSLKAYSDEQAVVGSCVTAFCLDKHADAINDPAARRWIADQTLAPQGQRYDRIGRVGQHYQLKTGYLDATSNPLAALWFATHNFQTFTPYAPGPAVIYRIDFDLFERACVEINAQNGWTGGGACRATDIRGTPNTLGPRAAAQQGWSLIHFESPSLQIHLNSLGGLHRFEFPRGTAIQWSTHLVQEQFRPQPDPIVAVFENVRDGRTPLRQVQDYIDQHYNSQLPRNQQVALTPQLLTSRFT